MVFSYGIRLEGRRETRLIRTVRRLNTVIKTSEKAENIRVASSVQRNNGMMIPPIIHHHHHHHHHHHQIVFSKHHHLVHACWQVYSLSLSIHTVATSGTNIGHSLAITITIIIILIIIDIHNPSTCTPFSTITVILIITVTLIIIIIIIIPLSNVYTVNRLEFQSRGITNKHVLICK